MKVIVNGNAIIDELKRQKLQIKELSEMTGISYSHLHKVINGRYHTSFSTAVLIAYKLNVDVNKLFKEIDKSRTIRDRVK